MAGSHIVLPNDMASARLPGLKRHIGGMLTVRARARPRDLDNSMGNAHTVEVGSFVWETGSSGPFGGHCATLSTYRTTMSGDVRLTATQSVYFVAGSSSMASTKWKSAWPIVTWKEFKGLEWRALPADFTNSFRNDDRMKTARSSEAIVRRVSCCASHISAEILSLGCHPPRLFTCTPACWTTLAMMCNQISRFTKVSCTTVYWCNRICASRGLGRRKYMWIRG